MQKEAADISDAYRSISAVAEGLYKDKGSRFISYAYPFSSPDELSCIMEKIRMEHHAARHHCFAYRVGKDGSVFRAGDDGEPSGSAGRPILGAIESAGLSDVLVVVVRYFGGILLGIPGLIRAYREAAADALSKAAVVWKYETVRLELEFDYSRMNDVQGALKSQQGVDVVARDFGGVCRMTVDVRLSVKDEFIKKLTTDYKNEKSTCIQCRSV